MAFCAGYILGIVTVLSYLVGEAFYEASRMKRRGLNALDKAGE